MTRPRILLTNDDGIWAPGLAALMSSISELGEVFVLAPATEMSATGHALSIRKRQALRQCHRDGCAFGYSFEGTPADCVKFAVAQWMEHPPHLVISGINSGPNFGTNVPYSGTVAAAIEAAMLGLPGMAVSVGSFKPHGEIDYTAAANVAKKIAREILANGMAPGTALNVNVPLIPEDQIQGIKVVPQGGFRIHDHYELTGGSSEEELWSNVGSELIYTAEGEETDDWAVRNNHIALTPLWYDMTAYKQLEHWRERF